MKFELDFERIYPHPPEQVWRALVEPAALGEWLMETDFQPKVGRTFKMWCDDDTGGTETYLCKVLEYDPPRRMLWSWALEGALSLGTTYVTFQVEAAESGTRLTITHSGDRDGDTIEKFKSGWPGKLDQLAAVLSAPLRT